METTDHAATPQPPQKNLLTIKDFAAKHPAFSEGSIRWLVFNRETNGFAHCFLKLGRKRILIDEDEFFRQVEKGRSWTARR